MFYFQSMDRVTLMFSWLMLGIASRGVSDER
jgi:hypothetical protein